MVTSSPAPRPLNIVIAGAGIGGITTAIALRQAGHTVEIFEKSRFNDEYGAAVNIPPNAYGLLRGIGLVPDEHGSLENKKLSGFSDDGTLNVSADTASLMGDYKWPWQYIHRVDLHNALKSLATSPTGTGTPVVIHTSSRAVSVDAENAILTLEDGSTHTSDLVIGADGVHSALRNCVDHSNIHPAPFGFSSFRWLAPTSELRSDPKTRRFVENSGEISQWGSLKQRMILYPCRGGELLNCACMLEDHEDPSTKKDWDGARCKEEVLSQCQHFHPDVLALLNRIDPAGLKIWPLYDMPTLSTWARGRAVLIGDAAHPFLPFQGQGAAQAIEDGITLATLLPLGTGVEDVEGRLKLYEKTRFERATKIQVSSRDGSLQNRGSHISSTLAAMKYNFGHDAKEFAEEALRESLNDTDVKG